MNSIDLIKNAFKNVIRCIVVDRHSSHHPRALNELPVNFENVLVSRVVVDVSLGPWLGHNSYHNWLVIQSLLLLKEFLALCGGSRNYGG